jgi:hypothetical protein
MYVVVYSLFGLIFRRTVYIPYIYIYPQTPYVHSNMTVPEDKEMIAMEYTTTYITYVYRYFYRF